MEYKIILRLQKCLYMNIYFFVLWAIVTAFFLYVKLDLFGSLTKYLAVTVFTLLLVIESFRLYLGHYGNLSCGVPELAGFLMLTLMMQMPLVSFFLFNPFLLSTPTEITLHTMLWIITMIETCLGFLALKKASNFAKSVYLTSLTER